MNQNMETCIWFFPCISVDYYVIYNFSLEAFLVELLHHGFLVLYGSMSPCRRMVEEFLLTERQYSTLSRRKGNLSDSVLVSRQSKLLLLVMRLVQKIIIQGKGAFLVAYLFFNYNEITSSLLAVYLLILADYIV